MNRNAMKWNKDRGIGIPLVLSKPV